MRRRGRHDLPKRTVAGRVGGYVISAVLVAWPFTPIPAASCAAELVERLQIPNSSWVVETWMAACGFGVSGPLEVFAVNKRTRERRIISVIEPPTHTAVSIDSANRLIITLPNLVNITTELTQFDEVKVIYNYLPHDDPQERAMFQRFMRNPNDPDAKQWYCQNVASKMDPANRDAWSRVVGCER